MIAQVPLAARVALLHVSEPDTMEVVGIGSVSVSDAAPSVCDDPETFVNVMYGYGTVQSVRNGLCAELSPSRSA